MPTVHYCANMYVEKPLLLYVGQRIMSSQPCLGGITGDTKIKSLLLQIWRKLHCRLPYLDVLEPSEPQTSRQKRFGDGCPSTQLNHEGVVVLRSAQLVEARTVVHIPRIKYMC